MSWIQLLHKRIDATYHPSLSSETPLFHGDRIDVFVLDTEGGVGRVWGDVWDA